MGEHVSPTSKPDTTTNVSSQRDSLSPVASKLVEHAVGQAFNGLRTQMDPNDSSGDGIGDEPTEQNRDEGVRLPNDTGEDSLLNDTDEDSFLNDAGEDSFLNDTDEDSLPNDTGEDSLPHETDEDSLPNDTRKNSLPHDTGEDSLPHETRKNSLPHDTGEDSLPHETRKDSLPNDTRKNSLPHETRKNSLPHETDEDSLPHDTRKNSLPRDSRKDSIPHDSRKDSLSHETYEDSLPNDTRKNSLPHATRKDSIPHDSRKDSIPHDSRKDSIPHDSRKDSIPHDSRKDSIPHDTRKNSLPNDTRKNSIPHDTEEDSTVKAKLTQSLPQFSANVGNSLERAQGASGAFPSDSTQVILPINPIPEESDLRVGPTASFLHKHTFPVESEVGNEGMQLHRNRASVELEIIQIGSSTKKLEEAEGFIGSIVGESRDQQRSNLSSARGSFETLIDEMASHVAKHPMPCSKKFLQEAYKRLATATATIAENIQTTSRDIYSSPQTANRTVTTGSSRLPAEVKDHMLRTLSDIKNQLDTVKTKLKK